MSFDWLHPDVPRSVDAQGRGKRQQDELAEAEYRARLYHSLGYAVADAVRRVEQNAAWEWELHGTRDADQQARLGQRVKQIYAMQDASATRQPPRQPARKP